MTKSAKPKADWKWHVRRNAYRAAQELVRENENFLIESGWVRLPPFYRDQQSKQILRSWGALQKAQTRITASLDSDYVGVPRRFSVENEPWVTLDALKEIKTLSQTRRDR